MKCRNKCVDHLGVAMHAVAGDLCSVCFSEEGIPDEEGILDERDTKGLNKYYAEMLIPVKKLRKESNFRLARLKALVYAIEVRNMNTEILSYITALCSPKQLWDIRTFAKLIQNLCCTTDEIIGVMKYFGKQFQDDSQASDTFQCLGKGSGFSATLWKLSRP